MVITTTLSIMTFSIKGLFATFCITALIIMTFTITILPLHCMSLCWVPCFYYSYTECHYAECSYAWMSLCWVVFITVISNVIMLSFVMLNVIMLSVVAPQCSSPPSRVHVARTATSRIINSAQVFIVGWTWPMQEGEEAETPTTYVKCPWPFQNFCQILDLR